MHFWSCDITKHGLRKIGHISAIFKGRDLWFGPKNSIKLCAEHFTIFGVIKCISGHDLGISNFLVKSANIIEIIPTYYLTFTLNQDYNLDLDSHMT